MQKATRRVSRGLCAAVSAAVLAGSCTQMRAADYFWTGGDATSTFDDPNNWSPGIGYPGSGGGTFDTATFGNTVTSPQPSLDISDSIGELIFQASAGGWTLGTTSATNVLTLNGANGFGIDATMQSSGTTDIQANLMVGAAQTWAVGSGGTLQIDGVISGSSALNIGASTGTGNVVLTANSNAFTGAVTIAANTTLQLGSGSIGGDGLVGGPIGLADPTSILTFNETAAETYGGRLSGPAGAALNNNSTAVLTFTALSPNFLGNTNIADGSTLQLGNGAGSATDGMLGGPINLATSNSVLTFNNVSAQTYPGAITGPTGSIVNDNGTGALTFTGSSTGFVGTAKIGAGATLQLGDGTTNVGILGSTSTIALASGTAPVSTLTFNEPSATSYSGTITGPAGSIINISGQTAGVTTTLTNLNPNFNGAANILTNDTLKFGDGTTGDDGLLGTTSTIALAGSSSVLNFNDAANQTYAGTITGPSSGGTIKVSGPAASLTLTTKDTGFHGTVSVAADSSSTSASTATLKLGTGASGKDALFGSSSTIVLANTTATSQGFFLNIDENTTETFPSTITWPAGGVGSGNNVYITGPGALTLSGALQMNSPAGTPFLNFQGTGNVTITGTLSMPSATGNAYLISNNTGSVTFSGANTMSKTRLYEGGNVPNTTWTMTKTASIGTSTTATSAVFFSNDNFNGAAPNPVFFNMGGSIFSGEVNVGDDPGPIAVNVTVASGSTALIQTPDLFLGELDGTQTNNPAIYGGLFIGANGKVQNATNASYVYLVGFSANEYGYINVANGGIMSLSQTLSAANNRYFIGNNGNAMVEVGTLNGSTTSTGTFNINVNNAGTAPQGLVLNEGGGAPTAGELAELNAYAGGTITYTPFTSAGTTIASGDTNFTANSLAGQFAAFNIIGGTVIDKGVNSPLTLSALSGATGILNLDADSNGVIGKLVASFVTAKQASSALTFVNFNGGELEFANNNAAAQGSLISGNITGGVFVYPGGAIVGTNASGAAPVNVTIPVALKAPAGSGVGSITITANAGYSSPPIVTITSGGGSDATAVAVLSGGQITIVVTNPGFGYTSPPTVTLTSDGAITPATATAVLAANTNTGGLTKVDTGTLILSAANTYGGQTLITSGTVDFTGASNATNAVTVLTTTSGNAAQLMVANATTANNIASAATILVGDVPASGSLPTAGSFAINNAASGGFVLSTAASQALGGFGTVTGTSTLGLTSGNQTVLAPGTTNATVFNATSNPTGTGPAVQSLTATPGGFTTTGTTTATFNTSTQGHATGVATGALTVTSGNSASPMTTTFGPGGTYYWKLNMNTGGTGQTLTPGLATNIDTTGANWDALILDSLNVTATPGNAFTVQAVGFTPTGTATNPVIIGTGTDPSYSWTIARIANVTGGAGILANLSLNTAGLPAASPGYNYYLSTQQDTNPADTDLVINYVPAPEPSALLLLAPAAGLLARRRRKMVTI